MTSEPRACSPCPNVTANPLCSVNLSFHAEVTSCRAIPMPLSDGWNKNLLGSASNPKPSGKKELLSLLSTEPEPMASLCSDS